MDDFPRLLVASEFPPNASGGGPAVVRQMLKGWPTEQLSWWSCFPDRDELFGQAVATHQIARIPPRWYPTQRLVRLRSWLMESCWTPWAGRHFRNTLATLRPDAVWVIPHAWAVPPLAAVLPGGHVGFHVTVQDYVDTRDRAERFGRARARWMAGLADKLYLTATTRDATSHPMIADLRARTGAEATQMLHAGLEDDDFAWLASKSERHSKKIQIAYAGTIIAEDEFALFVEALSRIRRHLPAPVSLEFFGNDTYRARTWYDPSWMHDRGNLAEPALTHALREYDWGFSPMDHGDPRGNRFSFPTKFISYLAAGLPVITLGDAESTLIKIATAYDVGLCTTERDPQALSARLLTALTEPDSWAKYRAGILRCATAEFNARRMRAMLYDCFQKCARFTRDVRTGTAGLPH